MPAYTIRLLSGEQTGFSAGPVRRRTKKQSEIAHACKHPASGPPRAATDEFNGR